MIQTRFYILNYTLFYQFLYQFMLMLPTILSQKIWHTNGFQVYGTHCIILFIL